MEKPLPVRRSKPSQGRNGGRKPPPGPGMKGKPDAGAPGGRDYKVKNATKSNHRFGRPPPNPPGS